MDIHSQAERAERICGWLCAVLIPLFLIFAVCCPAQVRIDCAPSPAPFGRAIFDHRTAKHIQHWSVVVTNDGRDAITVSEAEVQGWMIRRGVTTFSTYLVRIGSEEIKRRGRWQTVGRIAVDVAFIATALAAGDIVDLTAREGALLGFGALSLPRLGERLAKRDPDVHNFDRVAFDSELSVGPGESASFSMFAVRRDKADPISGILRQALDDQLDSPADLSDQAVEPVELIAGYQSVGLTAPGALQALRYAVGAADERPRVVDRATMADKMRTHAVLLTAGP